MHVVAITKRDEKWDKTLREQFPDVTFTYLRNIKDIGEHIHAVDVLVTYGEDVTEQFVYEAENLKWIMVMSAGIEKLPFQALMERNILVTNARGIHKIPMAEFVFGFILMHAKQLATFMKQKKEKVWNRRVKLQEVYGKTLIVVGAGAIGSEISKYAKTFGMKTIGINRSGKKNELFDETYSVEKINELLPRGDYIVSVLPSMKSTNYLFTMEQFDNMKRRGFH